MKSTTPTKKKTAEVATLRTPEHLFQYSWVIKNPRITEKATMLAEANVYTFEIHPQANKKEVMAAIKHIYGLVPESVRVVNIASVKTVKRNKLGRTKALRKAYVYLKKGDTITLI